MNPRHVTLRQFRYFIAVAESGSLAAASRMLNVAQSALTKAMAELEQELGSRLFERTSKGMALTPQGHRFLSGAGKVLGAVADAMRLNAAEPASVAGTLTVGVTSLVAGYYLSELLSRYRRNCPEVQVQVTEETPRFLEHLLINGELDVAIMVSNALGEPKALMAETLTRSASRVWLASNHPLAAHDEVSLAECAACEQIVLEADRIDDLMRLVWARHQLKPHVMMKTARWRRCARWWAQASGSPCCRTFSTAPGRWTPSTWTCGRCATRCRRWTSGSSGGAARG